MPVPSTQEINKPLLEIFKDEAPHNFVINELLELIAGKLDAELEEMSSTEKTAFKNNINDAIKYLLKKKLLSHPSKTTYLITRTGAEVLADDPDFISEDYFKSKTKEEVIAKPEKLPEIIEETEAKEIDAPAELEDTEDTDEVEEDFVDIPVGLEEQDEQEIENFESEEDFNEEFQEIEPEIQEDSQQEDQEEQEDAETFNEPFESEPVKNLQEELPQEQENVEPEPELDQQQQESTDDVLFENETENEDGGNPLAVENNEPEDIAANEIENEPEEPEEISGVNETENENEITNENEVLDMNESELEGTNETLDDVELQDQDEEEIQEPEDNDEVEEEELEEDETEEIEEIENEDDDADETSENSPSEIEELVKQYNDKLSENVLEQVESLHQDNFCMLVMDLLSKMGYRVFQTARYTNEAEGSDLIQGIILENKAGMNPIYIHAKKLSSSKTVSKANMLDFVNALSDKGGKGMFVTTGKFSAPADKAAKDEGIMLVDGKKLSSLMIANNFCVNTERIFELKSFDLESFSEYED